MGDSITSGEGTVGAVYEEDWISAFFSAENTYPRMVADALSAEYRVISQSGWGIVTGWDGNVENKIPPFYTQVCGLLTGGGMLLWERWKTMISKHGSRLHPGVKAHQITAKEIETYLQELL